MQIKLQILKCSIETFQNCSLKLNISNHVNTAHSAINKCKLKCYTYGSSSHLDNSSSF